MSMFHELMMRKKGMPSRYQEVEYIESTGTQYIDTGYSPNNETGLKVVISGSNFNSDCNFIGCRIQNGQRFAINYQGSTWNYGFNDYVTTTIMAGQNQENEFSLNYNNSKKFTVNSNSVDITTTLTATMPSIALFGQLLNTGTINEYSYKIHSCQISQGSSLVRNFIPVYDTLTQKYGMWESVQGKFYGNAGTGDFKGSIVGYTIVGSPTIVDGVVSGFSDSNYLETSQNFPNDLAYDDCEYQVKFTLPASISNDQQIIFTYFRGTNDGIRVTTGGRLRCFFGGSTNIVNSPVGYLTFGNTYVVRFINRNNKLSLYCGTDENNLQLVVSQDKASFINNSPLPVRIGINQQTNNYFSGSIDLNKTYIKVRGKLWFNGQQA